MEINLCPHILLYICSLYYGGLASFKPLCTKVALPLVSSRPNSPDGVNGRVRWLSIAGLGMALGGHLGFGQGLLFEG